MRLHRAALGWSFGCVELVGLDWAFFGGVGLARGMERAEALDNLLFLASFPFLSEGEA